MGPGRLLYFVSDRTGWSNLYVERDGESHALTSEEAELGYPQWVFDLSRYAFLGDDRIACIFTRSAVDGLEILDLGERKARRASTFRSRATRSPALRSHGTRVVFAAASPDRSPRP